MGAQIHRHMQMARVGRYMAGVWLHVCHSATMSDRETNNYTPTEVFNSTPWDQYLNARIRRI